MKKEEKKQKQTKLTLQDKWYAFFMAENLGTFTCRQLAMILEAEKYKFPEKAELLHLCKQVYALKVEDTAFLIKTNGLDYLGGVEIEDLSR